MAFPGFTFSADAQKTKSTTNSSGTFNNTTTPIVPEWASSLTQGVAGRVGGLLSGDPQSLIAPVQGLQSQAAAGAANLTGMDFNYDGAADLTRGAARTSWLDPHMSADTPFASGGKAYDYVDRYLNPYLNQVVDSSSADLDAHAGQVRAQQSLDLAGAGAFGGSGAALTQSLTEGELARARASTLSGLRSQAYNTALGAAGGDADRATQARIANAQTALQDRAQKVGFGFQGQQQQLQAANQLYQLSNAHDENLRGNIATQAGIGAALRGVDTETRQAPVTSTQQIVAMLSGLPINLFVGQNEQGTSSQTVKTSATKVGGGVEFKGS
ncbi:hypothetical protein [Phenylobacterium sp.]|uniref:hypothetical protein n=1 Tax=Phenylobacterium sp. TaxID=1871053 RepID=UPI0025F19F62|nr:hypothetical protein [Phenylobacterium sp.]